jgi:hypothetical protein
MATIGNTKTPPFFCEICQTLFRYKKDYEKHALTRKHLKSGDPQHISPHFSADHICSHCNKKYESRSGLWRHAKKCNSIKEQKKPEEVNTLTNMVMELMKSNSDLQKQLVDACKHTTNITNNMNNMNNSHNKTFNLQFFLNEQCKDAMNISDFANSFELQLSDLESVGELGYVEGITKIMLDKLNSMDIYKRPIHCSDVKREIIYVKDHDKWEREEKNNPKLRYAIKTVSFNNMKLAGLWSDTYPESKDGESRLNDVYMRLIKQSTGGNGEISDSEDKIIRRIAKEIFINKN